MRFNRLTRYFDRDTVMDQLGALSDRVERLGDLVPYRRRQPRGYALPVAIALGGIAALGLIAVGSLVVRRQLANAQYPEESEPKPHPATSVSVPGE